MRSTWRPRGTYLTVVPLLEAHVSAAGSIIIPEAVKKKPYMGIVSAVPPWPWWKHLVGLRVANVGDLIGFSQYAGQPFDQRDGGDEVLMVQSIEVIVVKRKGSFQLVTHQLDEGRTAQHVEGYLCEHCLVSVGALADETSAIQRLAVADEEDQAEAHQAKEDAAEGKRRLARIREEVREDQRAMSKSEGRPTWTVPPAVAELTDRERSGDD